MTKAQPSSRPGKLPRIRRGMKRPGSIISHAGAVDAADAEGATLVTSRREVFELSLWDRFNFNFPALGRGHSGSIGGLTHQVAGRRSVGNEDHSLRHLAFHAGECDLTVVRLDSNAAAGCDA